jgi:hypothetical protein
LSPQKRSTELAKALAGEDLTEKQLPLPSRPLNLDLGVKRGRRKDEGKTKEAPEMKSSEAEAYPPKKGPQ